MIVYKDILNLDLIVEVYNLDNNNIKDLNIWCCTKRNINWNEKNLKVSYIS